jgi:hypothetical protein
MALTTGVNAAIATYREQNTIPREEWGWDTLAGRLARYQLYSACHDNTVYSTIEAFSAKLKSDNRLYKHIRSIYSPVARQNQIIKSAVYKGSLNLETLTSGALPIQCDDSLIEPLTQIMRWSNLERQLSLYVHTAAKLGDAGLWVVNDPDRGRTRIEVLHPAKIREATRDAAGNVKSCLIEYVKHRDPDIMAQMVARYGSHPLNKPTETFVYTLKADQDGFIEYEDGEVVNEWDNPFSFVPLVIGHYDKLGLQWGVNSFYTCLPKIHEINDQASLISDAIRRVVAKPILKATGMSSTERIEATGSDPQRDELPILYLPNEKSDLNQIEMNLDIGAASERFESLIAELVKDMPELALQEMRDTVSEPTAPGVMKLYGDATSRIENARKNLDPPLLSALLMGVTMAAVSGYEGFGAFSRDSFDAGMMDAQVKARPVVDDSLSKDEELRNLLSLNDKPKALQRMILATMGKTDDEIETYFKELDEEAAVIAAAADAAQQANNRAAVRGWADSVFMNRNGANDVAKPTPEAQPVAS